jgi:MHS family proline/betaine transporter-like MFS transporter
MFALPPYSVIGVASCYLIALVRILQGISVGGEYSGAIIYAIEHFNKKDAGLVGGIVVSGCLLGVMVARLVSTILQNPDLPGYSWRFAFLLGFGLSIIGFFIRKKLTESPEFIANKKNKIPLLEGIKNYPLEMIAATLLVGVNGVNFYFVVVFLPGFLKGKNGIDIGYISLIITIVPAILAPLVGWLSDKANRGKVLLTGVGLIGIYSIVCLPIILKLENHITVALLILGYAALFAIQSGTLNTFSVEIFPARFRYSCGAFSYAVGMAIIGEVPPMIAALLTTKDDIRYVVLYVVFITFLGLLGGSLVVFKNSIWKPDKVKDIPVT